MSNGTPDEEAIFLAAVERVDPAERIAYLERVCADDPPLRRRVEKLLGAHEASRGPFDLPPPGFDGTLRQSGGKEFLGTRIGSFTLLREIGEGGMGVVYEAEQQAPVERRVALKIIKPGMDSRRVIGRFEAERQTLALMDHPNIAKVLDAGRTDSGHPFFVMELVDGVPITDYCNARQLTPRQRLELLIPACHAVQHAHQKGVIHRDLKPSNVLVAEYDGKPVLKVIDFGVAKAIGANLTVKTMFTESGQIVGTLEYMSPEQARRSSMDVDTRTDIYSLGVLLYELLAGSTPFDCRRLHSESLDEALRIIREEEPTKPSARLSSSGQLPIVAEQRGVEPSRLVSVVRGELDWIVMKALEKDRQHRYGTATELATDLARYLADEPVQACPPTTTYRFRKFARRNRRSLATASAALLGLIVALVIFSISNWRIKQEKERTYQALHRESEAKERLARSLENEQATQYYYRISLAHRELMADNLAQAVTLLEQCPTQRRQWEWHYLNRLCREEPRVLQIGEQACFAVAFSPDSRRVATGNGDGSISVFDTGATTPSQTLAGHDGNVFSVAFHPDGHQLASAGSDRRVILWNLDTGKPVFRWNGHDGAFMGAAYSVAFNHDGSGLAAADEGGAVVIRNTANGESVQTLRGHTELASAVTFSSDGRFLVTGDRGGVVHVWEASTGRLLNPRRRHGNLPICAIAFHPNNQLFATAGYDRMIKVWNVAQRREIRTLRGHWGLVTALAFSPDGARLASSGEDKTVKLWDISTGTEILNLRGHTQPCPCVTFSPDGQALASSSLDGTVRIWDTTELTSAESHELLSLRHENEVWSVACSPDGHTLAVADWGRTVRIWDTATGEPLRRFEHAGVLFQVTFSPDGRWLLSASGAPNRRASVTLRNAETGEEVRPGVGSPRDVMPLHTVAFSPDGRYVLKGRGSQIAVCDINSGREIHSIEAHAKYIWCLTFSPDGRLLASAANDGWVKIWHADSLETTTEPCATIPVNVFGFCNRVVFSGDGRRLFTAGDQHTIQVWDATQTNPPLKTLRGHTGDVYALAVSPDGRWLASAGEDTTIRLWDVETGQQLHTLRGHRSPINSITFVPPDGQRLVSGSRDHEVKVWDLPR